MHHWWHRLSMMSPTQIITAVVLFVVIPGSLFLVIAVLIPGLISKIKQIYNKFTNL
jgi:hypothetical protein